MNRHIVVVALMVLASAVVVADEVSLGYYTETGFFDSIYATGTVEDFNFYVEHTGEFDYTLFMLDKSVSKHEKIGIRFDDPDIW